MDASLKNNILNNFKTTEIGLTRIRTNLKINDFSDTETVSYLKKILQSTAVDEIILKGKNYYFNNVKNNAILMMNTQNYTIISAEMINKN